MKRFGFVLTVVAALGGAPVCLGPASGQSAGDASPIYGITIPAGYRDWRLISVNHLEGARDNLKQVRAQLGNDIAIEALRAGKLPFPTAPLLPRCIGMKRRRPRTTRSWRRVFPAPASDLSLPVPP